VGSGGKAHFRKESALFGKWNRVRMYLFTTLDNFRRAEYDGSYYFMGGAGKSGFVYYYRRGGSFYGDEKLRRERECHSVQLF
jgi:hypothetical protein